MFRNCKSLSSIDLYNLYFGGKVIVDDMFTDCQEEIEYPSDEYSRNILMSGAVRNESVTAGAEYNEQKGTPFDMSHLF